MPKQSDTHASTVKVYFSDFFGVTSKAVESYGAFDISLLGDLPLFVDPFLLFHSKKPAYRALHESIIKYIRFLKVKAADPTLDAGLLRSWYMFPEIEQNWLGFSVEGNRGRGLGRTFANALHEDLGKIFGTFGNNSVTTGQHLEKLCLIRDGVGRDNISDLTNNLIHEYLLDYTQGFARKYIDPSLRKTLNVARVRFNYTTEAWEASQYDLPWHGNDYVLLTPRDMLTREDTWINKSDLLDRLIGIPESIANDALRAQIDNYLRQILPRNPTAREKHAAAIKVVRQFPALIDNYIKRQEDAGNEAEAIAGHRVDASAQLYLEQFRTLINSLKHTTLFYSTPGDTYDDAYRRVMFFKDVIENKGGHRIFYIKGQPIEREEDLHILFRMTWYAAVSDVTREANDGRGPADFKISRGSTDKTLVEFKLATNPQLARNLLKQSDIYEKASDARKSIKVIVYFTAKEKARAEGILEELKLTKSRDVVLVDARGDNKPSGSKA